jgi:hypothetical protein
LAIGYEQRVAWVENAERLTPSMEASVLEDENTKFTSLDCFASVLRDVAVRVCIA